MPKCFEYGELGLGTSAIYSFGDFFVCEGGWYKGIKRCEKRSQIMSQLPHMKWMFSVKIAGFVFPPCPSA